MGQFKDIGDPAAGIIEECGEVIQVIAKKIRFGRAWTDIPPGKDKSRIDELHEELKDLMYHYGRLLDQLEEETKTHYKNEIDRLTKKI